MFIMEQKNIFKSSIWKVFEIFVDEPLKIHYIKEISRKINLAPTSVKKHIQDLENQKIIIKKQGERFIGHISNRDNEYFLFYKKIFNLIKIKESKLTEYIIKTLNPKTIILYGSYSIGEDVETSDIDIAIISNIKKQLDFEKYEKILNRKIHVLIEKDLKKIQKAIKIKITNGENLYGYLEE